MPSKMAILRKNIDFRIGFFRAKMADFTKNVIFCKKFWTDLLVSYTEEK